MTEKENDLYKYNQEVINAIGECKNEGAYFNYDKYLKTHYEILKKARVDAALRQEITENLKKLGG